MDIEAMAAIAGAIRELTAPAAIAAGSLVAGCAAIIALRRSFGVEAAARRAPGARDRRERLAALSDRVGRLMPASRDQLGDARDSLMRAGLDMTPSMLWSLRVAGALLGLAVGGALGLAVGGVRGAALAAALTAAGAMLPGLWVLARRSRWRSEIEAQLPDALDLMTIAMSAGASFDAAIRVAAEEMDGSLARGLRQVSEEAGYTSRSEALVRFADRAQVPSLTVFAASLSQAEKTGGSLVDILRSQAETVRKQRRLAVEEKAGSLSAKMLIPMIAFIFPCFALIIVTPMVGVMLESLGG